MSAVIKRLEQIVEALRSVDPEMQLQQVLVFLKVINAGDEGVSTEVIRKSMDLPQSSASRAVAALSDWSYLKRPGLGLVTMKEDLMDRRSKIVKLSPKGKRLAELIKTLMEK